MRLLAISVLSWSAGLGAYLAVLKITWGQSISRGDLLAVVFSSLLAAAVAIGVGFAPVMFAAFGVTFGAGFFLFFARRSA
jgi:hypothetical protein